jgi:cytochrome b subunit of formate dehydrogenase
MALAFLTGALASGLAAGALTAALVWVTTVLTGSEGAWGVAPYLILVVALAFATATYAAERIARARDLQRRRATGEPWAYRQD